MLVTIIKFSNQKSRSEYPPSNSFSNHSSSRYFSGLQKQDRTPHGDTANPEITKKLSEKTAS